MSKNNRKIAGFMSAESIYSLAFYIVMVAAIAGVGASVLTNKDSAKAAAAISLLRANYVAESAGLGYAPVATAPALYRMSGNLLVLDTVPAIPTVTLPGGSGLVTLALRGAAVNGAGGFSINVNGIAKPAICNAIAGVGFGTWVAVFADDAALPNSTTAVPNSSKIGLKTICDAAGTAAANVMFVSE